MTVFSTWRMRAAALAAGGLSACALTPSPAPVLLTLPPAALAAAGATAASTAAAATFTAAAAAGPMGAASGAGISGAPLLAVRRVNIPEYLVARRVRYRADASTLAEWPNTYWAERIEIGVSREFVAALRQQLPGWALCDTNCGDQVPALTVQIDLLPMDYLRSAKTLRAGARITVSGGGVAPKVLQTQELAYELPAGADTAQAQAETIATLIQQVAAATAPMVRGVAR